MSICPLAVNTVLMVMEAIVIIPLLCAWQWFLINRAERVRMVQWMLMVALPMPIIRTLCSRPAKVGALLFWDLKLGLQGEA